MKLDVTSLTGDAIGSVLPDLARLRMIVFRDWPYLYDGSLDYEEQYLATFAAAPGAVCVIARDGEKIVGASTGLPMVHADHEFKGPFANAGYDIADVFYCGESVLLPSHRGGGVGHAFFDQREAQARRLGGFKYSAFCRVVRPDNHPLKPNDYRPLDSFWSKRGYAPVAGLIAHFDWKDLDQPAETSKDLQFWMREL